MKGYVSKYDKAKSRAKSMLPNGTPAELSRVTKQIFAKMIVGFNTTISKVDGKLVLKKQGK